VGIDRYKVSGIVSRSVVIRYQTSTALNCDIVDEKRNDEKKRIKEKEETKK
jgi:hypothetical protein